MASIVVSSTENTLQLILSQNKLYKVGKRSSPQGAEMIEISMDVVYGLQHTNTPTPGSMDSRFNSDPDMRIETNIPSGLIILPAPSNQIIKTGLIRRSRLQSRPNPHQQPPLHRARPILRILNPPRRIFIRTIPHSLDPAESSLRQDARQVIGGEVEFRHRIEPHAESFSQRRC